MFWTNAYMLMVGSSKLDGTNVRNQVNVGSFKITSVIMPFMRLFPS